ARALAAPAPGGTTDASGASRGAAPGHRRPCRGGRFGGDSGCPAGGSERRDAFLLRGSGLPAPRSTARRGTGRAGAWRCPLRGGRRDPERSAHRAGAAATAGGHARGAAEREGAAPHRLGGSAAVRASRGSPFLPPTVRVGSRFRAGRAWHPSHGPAPSAPAAAANRPAPAAGGTAETAHAAAHRSFTGGEAPPRPG